MVVEEVVTQDQVPPKLALREAPQRSEIADRMRASLCARTVQGMTIS